MLAFGRTLLVASLAALAPAACAQRHSGPRAGALPMPVMPLAQGHIPPLATQTPGNPADAAIIPMRIAQVSRRGRMLRLAWDAPGATSAVVSFSADGTAFRTMSRTVEPMTQFAPPAPHGIIRIFVTDGKRRNTVDYRI